MASYKPPLQDITFTLADIVGIGDLTDIPAFAEATPDLVEAVIGEAGRFTSEVIAPLNRVGDSQGSVLENGVVRTPEGFADAYRQYVEGGWNGICGPAEYGGQGMPMSLGVVVQEMMSSANLSLSLCPMLGQGAVEAIQHHGSEAQKQKYLEKLISGEWTGTMNLTEPQAGSDVGALRTKAEPQGDGSYLINGQKIFITYGDHDFTDNVIHLVLARLPDAPAGTKGISLFIVPKFMVGDDGSIGERNDLRVVSLEHKLGIHASPTCVMSYGDSGKCVGYLLGEENKGMRCMFTMMNNARLNVGMQGVGIAELAYQQAASYAADRVQSAPIGAKQASATIIEHADVRRMLLTIKAYTEASRAITYLNAKALDIAGHSGDEATRRQAAGLGDLLTPMSKAFSTDIAVETASMAVQVHGGMGFIEETGVAQTLRDARITPIYEGTNGIQALDLVGRKLNMEDGEHWKRLLDDMAAFIESLPEKGTLAQTKAQLAEALAATREASDWLVAEGAANMRSVAAGATPYLRLFSMTVGGYMLARGAVSALGKIESGEGDKDFLKGKVTVAQFFAEQLLPQAVALKPAIMAKDDILFEMTADQLVN